MLQRCESRNSQFQHANILLCLDDLFLVVDLAHEVSDIKVAQALRQVWEEFADAFSS